jgi:hypothetical protein
MRLNKHQLRNIVNEEYIKIDTKKQINEFSGKEVFKQSIKNILKSAGLAIPGIDIWLGSIIASADLVNVKLATDRMIKDLPVVGNSIVESLSGTDDEWKTLLFTVQNLPKEERDQLKEIFNELLASIKDLVLTIIQAYDSAAAAPVAVVAGAASAGTGAVGVEVATNLTTGIGSLIAGVMPIERFLFTAGTRIAKALEWVMSFIKETQPDKAIDIGISGGIIAMLLTDAPFLVISRLGELYDVLYDEGKSGLSALADIESTDVIDVVADSFTGQLSESRFRKLAGIK